MKKRRLKDVGNVPKVSSMASFSVARFTKHEIRGMNPGRGKVLRSSKFGGLAKLSHFLTKGLLKASNKVLICFINLQKGGILCFLNVFGNQNPFLKDHNLI